MDAGAPAVVARVARVALAHLRAAHRTWTRAGLMRQSKVSLRAEEFGAATPEPGRVIGRFGLARLLGGWLGQRRICPAAVPGC